MQSRDADLGDFFCHEVQPFPPSLSEFGNLHLPSMKFELLKCIAQPRQPDPPTRFDCRICDCAVIVHCHPVTGAITFDDYAKNVFIPHIRSQGSRRVDVVWDTYVPDSLKESTREKRGKGVRRKFHHLKVIQPDLDLWVVFGMGRNFSFISVNIICAGLGEARSRSLPVFHALSGCDTTSTFYGKGKKSAWQAWELYPDVTPPFIHSCE
ncbi:hypothetical protein OS493_020892 [Desmophyllum pertusum]|uniref:Uncharacterized protein n=1 Tax=Desmophyllum pertusum TaxID=174260 RepID=A0A9W9YBC3_9CNID|nr:hypothetical protein OS493_020892 [Desmophyllum pertusum]